MADIKKTQIIQKTAAEEYLTLYPETSADIVYAAVEGISADNVQDALAELVSMVSAITGGGVVTGVKGNAETEYRMGDVNITAENIGLGNVDNTSDEDKPISTATQAAIEAVEAKIPTDTVTSEQLLDVELASGASLRFTEDTNAYTYTLGLYNSAGALLGDLIEVDLPVEQLVMTVTYDADKKAIIVSLENGSTTEIPVADLVDGLVSEDDFEEAVTELNGRIDTINTAEQNVEESVKTAQAAAETAQAAAEAAQTAADTAEAHVTEVKTTAENAQTDATQALSDAAAASTAASTAQSTAENAQSDATQALSDAASAASAASTAQSTADTAITNAAAAQTAAESASTAASAAQSTADNASTAAAAAQTTAEAAQSSADSASTAASAAQSTADSASTAAATAQSTADAISEALTDATITGTYSAVGVNDVGVVVAGQNIIELWEKGQTSSDTLAIGGFAFIED